MLDKSGTAVLGINWTVSVQGSRIHPQKKLLPKSGDF